MKPLICTMKDIFTRPSNQIIGAEILFVCLFYHVFHTLLLIQSSSSSATRFSGDLYQQFSVDMRTQSNVS